MFNMIEKMNNYIVEIENELKDNILPFWINHVVDEENGGFYGLITNDLIVDKQAPKGCILNSRILWTFSAAYRVYNNPEYLKMADMAYNYLINHFWDYGYSGLYWMLDYKGNPTNTRKQIYCQAFGIYALSEYYRVTGNKGSLERAIELFRVLEEKSYDRENKGYIEACTREWLTTNDLALSGKDLNEKKSMNTHLHVLEAYTNLFRVWDSVELKKALSELLDVTIDYIIDDNTYHFKLFFDEYWNSRMECVSFGHDIEGSWLLYEAAEVLGDEEIIERVGDIAINMAQRIYDEGIDLRYGGIFNEAEHGKVSDSDKIWWCHAEAIVGFINAYELTFKEHFIEAAYNMWDFTNKYIIDKVHGEWFWKVSREGKVYCEDYKVEPWKCPYHNVRACIEAVTRLKKCVEHPIYEGAYA